MVESTALEMRHTGNRIGGSNPSLSANRARIALYSAISTPITGPPRGIATVNSTLALRCRNDRFEPIPPFACSHDEQSGCILQEVQPDRLSLLLVRAECRMMNQFPARSAAIG